jgi:hypothetical protein
MMMFDNREKSELSQQRSVQEPQTLLMGLRRGLPEHSGDSEPVLVLRNGTEVILTLDDGEQLVLDALELANAIRPQVRLAA